MENIQIRPATINDMAAVHALVMELAIYEKAPEAVATTVDSYRKDFQDQKFEVLVAEHEQRIIGMALFYEAYSTWKGPMMYLDDLVVTQSYRRHGIGERLFLQLAKITESRKMRLMKWQVLDWNTPAIEFYKKHEAEIEKGWWNGKMVFEVV